MPDIGLIYKSQSDKLKAEDLGTAMPTVTISEIETVDFNDGSKLVLSFEGKDKKLVLNVTNARSIAELYGHNSDNWLGQKIMLFSMPVTFEGRQTNGIRIRAPEGVAAPAFDQSPQQDAPAPAPATQEMPDDEIPF